MTRVQGNKREELTQLATHAISQQRRFAEAYSKQRDLLTHAGRECLDKCVGGFSGELFTWQRLADAQAALSRLETEMQLAGGVPHAERCDAGNAHLVGGSPASHHLHELADHLKEALDPAWKVHDRLLAEKIISTQIGGIAGQSEGGLVEEESLP